MSFVLSICFIAEAPEISISYTVYELDQLVGLKKRKKKRRERKRVLQVKAGRTDRSESYFSFSESKHSFLLI